MYCIICQKSFKNTLSYNTHCTSKNHKNTLSLYNKDRREFRKKLTDNFISDFYEYVSCVEEYTEINNLYKRFISKSKCRIQGTFFKDLGCVVDKLKNRISVQMCDGEVYVKQNSVSRFGDFQCKDSSKMFDLSVNNTEPDTDTLEIRHEDYRDEEYVREEKKYENIFDNL
ncbi:hypothetical protein CWI36_1030p0030 [Hamiltosporidium magnivora]|uniref:C2H2-type domain-containing protein n=1 Tax=Hamiltosporidium magnivora TaxID=148818 RepID=A0A4Q9L5L8_9MICR|nr:hypothetical protein CWI36_1030p0030 [Hamiltosporidium magnivora]